MKKAPGRLRIAGWPRENAEHVAIGVDHAPRQRVLPRPKSPPRRGATRRPAVDDAGGSGRRTRGGPCDPRPDRFTGDDRPTLPPEAGIYENGGQVLRVAQAKTEPHRTGDDLARDAIAFEPRRRWPSSQGAESASVVVARYEPPGRASSRQGPLTSGRERGSGSPGSSSLLSSSSGRRDHTRCGTGSAHDSRGNDTSFDRNQVQRSLPDPAYILFQTSYPPAEAKDRFHPSMETRRQGYDIEIYYFRARRVMKSYKDDQDMGAPPCATPNRAEPRRKCSSPV